MQTIIVKYTLSPTISGSYPVMQDVSFTESQAEQLARDWCKRGQRNYVSHRVVEDGRTRAQEEADYRRMCQAERRRGA